MQTSSLICILLAVALWPADAHAYVDPGSGMLIWQGLVALIGAVIMFMRQPKEMLKKLLERLRRK